MLEHTRERTTGDFVDVTFRIPKDKLELAKRVLDAIIDSPDATERDEDDTPLSIEEALGPSTPGAALRGYRYREALTQAQLAAKIGVSKQRISDLETGRRPIGPKTARRLAEVLGLDARRLLTMRSP